MSLNIITQQEIIEKRKSVEEIKDIVLLVNPECAGCAGWESLIEEIVETYPQISFSKLVVDADSLPVFSPPVVPSIIALDNGYRVWEALGALETTGPIEVMIDDWLNGIININHISGGISIQAI